ncbi:MAG: uracil-DNA glycosylase [Pirellulales bacterium]
MRHVRALAQKLESLHQAGVTHLGKAKVKARADAKVAAQIAVPPAQPAPASPPGKPKPAMEPRATATPSASLAERLTALDALRGEVTVCTRCKELAATRTQTVFGVGNPKPRLCFLGEAPGADEDRLGEPFVGAAGKLLTKIIEACTLKRSDVYIMNVLKCRPPGNRTPLPEEIENCSGFRTRQLEILQPEFICCLGAVAAQALLQTTVSIGQLRGRFHEHGGARVLCTYHPAYLLRNPPAKKLVWEDMKLLMRAMGIEIPATGGQK